jgi:hypothetical protein
MRLRPVIKNTIVGLLVGDMLHKMTNQDSKRPAKMTDNPQPESQPEQRMSLGRIIGMKNRVNISLKKG